MTLDKVPVVLQEVPGVADTATQVLEEAQMVLGVQGFFSSFNGSLEVLLWVPELVQALKVQMFLKRSQWSLRGFRCH